MPKSSSSSSMPGIVYVHAHIGMIFNECIQIWCVHTQERVTRENGLDIFLLPPRSGADGGQSKVELKYRFQKTPPNVAYILEIGSPLSSESGSSTSPHPTLPGGRKGKGPPTSDGDNFGTDKAINRPLSLSRAHSVACRSPRSLNLQRAKSFKIGFKPRSCPPERIHLDLVRLLIAVPFALLSVQLQDAASDHLFLLMCTCVQPFN